MPGARHVQRLLAALYRAPRTRRAAKATLSAVLPLVGPRLRNRLLQSVERVIYANTHDIDRLPEAFHYWSNAYLRPRLEAFGFANAVEFYALQVQALASGIEGPVRIASLGSGRAEVELAVCELLASRGVASTWCCVELNPQMQDDARRRIAATPHASRFTYATADAGRWAPAQPFDAIVCNQFLHHVPAVEAFVGRLQQWLSPAGMLLTHDVIGDRGHVLWPNARQVVDQIWPHLPEAWKQDRSGRQVDPYEDLDCSAYSLEGIDAGNVLPALLRHMHPCFFFGYSTFVLTFLDRRFGDGVDLGLAENRRVIDILATTDFELLEQGLLAPTQMFGAFRRQPFGRVEGNLAPDIALTARTRNPPERLVASLTTRLERAAADWDSTATSPRS